MIYLTNSFPAYLSKTARPFHTDRLNGLDFAHLYNSKSSTSAGFLLLSFECILTLELSVIARVELNRSDGGQSYQFMSQIN